MFRSPERFGTVFIIPAMLFVGLTWGPLRVNRPRFLLATNVALIFAVLPGAHTAAGNARCLPD